MKGEEGKKGKRYVRGGQDYDMRYITILEGAYLSDNVRFKGGLKEKALAMFLWAHPGQRKEQRPCKVEHIKESHS